MWSGRADGPFICPLTRQIHTEAFNPISGGRSLHPMKNRGREVWLRVYAKFLSPRGSVVYSSKCTANRLAAELCPDPLEELTALTQIPQLG